jgi:hypothetical protein
MLVLRRCSVAGALVLASWIGAAAAEIVPPSEQALKAAYLFNFAKYVEWPASAPAEPQWVIGILGDAHFGEVLERTLAGKTARERGFVTRQLAEPQQAAQAHMLYIATSEAPRLPEILKALEGSSVLTVSDIDGFAEKGGMIGFRREGNKVKFDISPQQATRAGLRISSQLLALARVVPAR